MLDRNSDPSIVNTNLDKLLQSNMPALGIDIGGTKISAALVSNSKLVSEPIKVHTPEGNENIIDALYEIIESYKSQGLIAGVGIATAGVVDTGRGTVVDATGNLPGWTGTNIKQVLEPKTMLPVHVENDANAAAYGEFKARIFTNNHCTVVITLGTGIGGGIILQGNLYRGDNFSAGEVGHLKISFENKRLCTCGHFDCWEAYGSGPGLVHTARELLLQAINNQSDLVQYGDNLSTYHIIDSANKGDILAVKAFNFWHQHVSIGLVTIAQILNPGAFIISGGMSQFVKYGMLKELVSDKCLNKVSEKLEIFQSELGVNAGIIGAGQIVLDKLVFQNIH